jgi:hypothetical protein
MTLHHKNYVLLLRHCVRSTKETIDVCFDENDEKTKEEVDVTEWITAPIPHWQTPPMWCTERGMNIIIEEGKFLVSHLFSNVTSRTHVQFRFVSDRSQRDLDTFFGLSEGMMQALHTRSKLLTFHGFGEIQLAPEIFKPEAENAYKGRLCPQAEDYTDEFLTNEITERMSQLPPQSFGVPSLVNLLTSLGTLRLGLNISNIHDHRCPGKMGLSFNVIKEIAEMAFYSRASAVVPPFLPAASKDQVYQMLAVADYIRNVERIDTIRAAKGGLVLAKSLLAALQETTPTGKDDDKADTAIVTVYVAHDSDIDHIATALGLRWTMSHPYLNHDNILGTPPGSGMIFSSTSSDPNPFQDISMSFLCAINLMEETDNNLNAANIQHQLTPMFPFGNIADAPQRNVNYRVDKAKKAGIVSMEYLRSCIQDTLGRYPSLQSCYDRAPIVVGRADNDASLRDIEMAPHITTVDLFTFVTVALIVSNSILLACLVSRRARAKTTAEAAYEKVSVKKRSSSNEFELT